MIVRLPRCGRAIEGRGAGSRMLPTLLLLPLQLNADCCCISMVGEDYYKGTGLMKRRPPANPTV